METYIKKAEDLDAVNINFMPPLLDAILGDYNRNVPASRDAEVLNVMATIVVRLGVRFSTDDGTKFHTEIIFWRVFWHHKFPLSWKPSLNQP